MGIYVDNQVLYQCDLNNIVMAIQGDTVDSGLLVHATDPATMNILIDAGYYYVGSTRYNNSSQQQKTIEAADPTNPRYDIVTIAASAVITVTKGTAAETPVPPSIPANNILLAIVQVPAGATSITNSNIRDRRMWANDVAVKKSGDTMSGDLTFGDAYKIAWSDCDISRSAANTIKISDNLEIGGALDPNGILQAFQKFKGVFWFNNNWFANIVEHNEGGSASLEWVSYYVLLKTGVTQYSYIELYKYFEGLTQNYTWAKKRLFGVLVQFKNANNRIIHIVTGTVDDYNISANITSHIGFKLVDNTLYGTVGNGTAESTLQLETSIGDVYRTLECIFTPGVECRFYVDSVDKGAITTNLPSGTGVANNMLYATIYNSAAAEKKLYIYESRTFQEE